MHRFVVIQFLISKNPQKKNDLHKNFLLSNMKNNSINEKFLINERLFAKKLKTIHINILFIGEIFLNFNINLTTIT